MMEPSDPADDSIDYDALDRTTLTNGDRIADDDPDARWCFTCGAKGTRADGPGTRCAAGCSPIWQAYPPDADDAARMAGKLPST
jgi:hypothetical protein